MDDDIKHDPNPGLLCDLRHECVWQQNQIEDLRAEVAMLRHAADLQAEALTEQQQRADRLQALIDAYAEMEPGSEDALLAAAESTIEWHTMLIAVLAVAVAALTVALVVIS